MKLRNKKTGDVSTRIDVSENGELFWVLGKKPYRYETLAELNAEWEDYKEEVKPTCQEVVDGLKQVMQKVSEIDAELGEVLHAAVLDYELLTKGYWNGKPNKYAKQYRYAQSEKGKATKRRYYLKKKAELCGEEEE